MAAATSGLRLHVTFTVNDFDKFMVLAKKAMAATRKEAGCLHYELFHEVDDASKTKVAMIEHWESAEALADHAKAAHVKEFLAAAKDLLVEPPALKKYTSCGY